MKQTAAPHITLLKGIVTALCLMMICPLQCYSQVEKVNKPVRNRSGVHQPVSTATDSTAMTLAMDNDMPMVCFALNPPENILRVVRGEAIGTTVTVKED